MTTRYTARPKSRFNVPGLPTGYEGNVSTAFTVPSVGIEDVDRALFNLFNNEIPLIVSGDGVDSQRCPVIFFAGEKWALNKKLRALKDRNGSIILPLCTAVRTIIKQDMSEDITGRGINQQTGEIVIHRRLDKSDRGYQSLINRLLLQHQQNLAVNPATADPGQLTTLNDIGDLANDPTVRQGGLMLSNHKNNVFETIIVPAPQFFTAIYDITLWTQYTSHMNQLIEQLIASQLPQGNAWRLDTPKGYWFVAKVDENTYTADTNTDDYSQTERVIKYKFTIKVPGYILASSVPGAPVPIRRYVSSPSISFEPGIITGETDESADTVANPFLGADDPTLPLTTGEAINLRPDQRNHTDTKLYPSDRVINPNDPALNALPRGTKPSRYKKAIGIDKNGNQVVTYLRVNSATNAQGETVMNMDMSLGGLNIVVLDG